MLRKNKNVVEPEPSYVICGLCFKIHNQLGRYRSEGQYCDAFEKLLKEGKIEHEREKPLPPSFEGGQKRRNIPDFVIKEKIIIDLKAKPFVAKEDYYQMRRYIDSYNKELGIIINFRQKYLYPKRILKKIN